MHCSCFLAALVHFYFRAWMCPQSYPPANKKRPAQAPGATVPLASDGFSATEKAVPRCSYCPHRKAVLSGRCPAVPTDTSLDASYHADRVSLFRTKKQVHETSHEPVLRGSDRIRTYDTPGMNRMLYQLSYAAINVPYLTGTMYYKGYSEICQLHLCAFS